MADADLYRQIDDVLLAEHEKSGGIRRVPEVISGVSAVVLAGAG